MLTIDAGFLADDFPVLDRFFERITRAASAKSYIFDLSDVVFMTPANIIGMIIGARFLEEHCRAPVIIKNIPDNTLHYLERMDVFRIGEKWLLPEAKMPEGQWTRSNDTDNLLELTPVCQEDDVFRIVKQVNEICKPLKLDHFEIILSIISELCQNALDHSGDDNGLVMAQRYHNRSRDVTTVHISIGDFGKGVRQSLVDTYGEFAQKTSDYLIAALGGKTARKNRRGGVGLRSIEDTITRENGFLWFRSYDGVVISRGKNNRRIHDQRANIPGTQVTVKLEGPLPLEYKLK